MIDLPPGEWAGSAKEIRRYLRSREPLSYFLSPDDLNRWDFPPWPELIGGPINPDFVRVPSFEECVSSPEAVRRHAERFFPDRSRVRAVWVVEAACVRFGVERTQNWDYAAVGWHKAKQGPKVRRFAKAVRNAHEAPHALQDAYDDLHPTARDLLDAANLYTQDDADEVERILDGPLYVRQRGDLNGGLHASELELLAAIEKPRTQEIAAKRLAYRLRLAYRTFGGQLPSSRADESTWSLADFVGGVLILVSGNTGEHYLRELAAWERERGE